MGLNEQQAIKCLLWLGFVQGVIAVFVRYIFFDASKEIVFIALDANMRKKSKGAVDVVGSRLGKSLSSYIHVFVLGLSSLATADKPIQAASFILMCILVFFCFLWMYSIRFLAPYIDTKEKKVTDI